MGKVYLVGAGPGDPGLLTLRSADVLRRADAVLYDVEVSPGVLERCSSTAVRTAVDGRDPREIGRLLAELARKHAIVVRLCHDSVFTRGQGSEEALVLNEEGIAFDVIPGIPADAAGPVYAGIPVLHPGMSASVTVIDLPARGSIQWDAVLRGASTVVVRCGAGQPLDELRHAGLAKDRLAAVIEWPTSVQQRTRVGPLGSLLSDPATTEADGPRLVVVGDVVRLREQLRWFESRPLFGKRVVVTRPRTQAEGFVAALEDLGAVVVPFPTIRIDDPADPEPLRRAAAAADRFDWIVFTSVNGVERFWEALRAVGRDTRALSGVHLCAIGPATAAAIELEGARADLVPDEYVAEAVVEALTAETDLRGSRILLARAEVARSVLPDSLRESGAEVVDVVAYRTVPDGAAAGSVRQQLEAGVIDVITFTASSTVRNFVELLGADIGEARVAAIGPITSQTARELGLPVHIQATEFTVPGLIRAIREHFTGGTE